MIAYVLLAIALLGVGFYGGYQFEAGRWAKESAARLEAEAQVADVAAKLKAEQQAHVEDLATAFEAGQSKARIIYRNVQARGSADVVNYPVFSNRACDWPAASVLLVNNAFANLRAPADTVIPDAALPASAAAAGGAAGPNLPLAPVPAGTVEPVRPDARAASGSGQVPATGSGKPPKPTPRSK